MKEEKSVTEKAIEILTELCQLKKYKDSVGKDDFYKEQQPKAWEEANKLLNSLVGVKVSDTTKDHSSISAGQQKILSDFKQELEKEVDEIKNNTNGNYKAFEEGANWAKDYFLSQLKEAKDEIERLKGKQCNHEWVSSVAYKGAKYCPKCGALK
jgi:hypothetical protein